jgi:hypothetical protein
MATNGINAPVPANVTGSRRLARFFSGIGVRLLIAFVLSWIIIMALAFLAPVVSH